jgi:HlyD family secretion protein
MKRILIGVVILAVVGGWIAWRRSRVETSRVYRTVALERGTVVQTVKATGTVRPILTVQVGTQVNGPVRKLYVDFNSAVKAGDLVAQIDPTVYEARVAQDVANLQQAEASLEESETRLRQAEKELERSRELAKRELISVSDLDAAIANRDTLAANVKVSHASVNQAQATLQVSKANHSYTTIRAPVDGVVIARNVSEGQTVVASMSAQTLFEIATDLARVQVEASIPEADIGRIRPGQPVDFTVDAHDRSFTGRVEQIRLAAATTQNVVTYPVVIRAENPDRILYPGMTANISCETARRENVLRIPNAALRFKPDVSDPARPPDAPSGNGAAAREAFGQAVWILDKDTGIPMRVPVKTGIQYGVHTEALDSAEPTEGRGLREGDILITGYDESDRGPASKDPVNPFAPSRPGGGGGRRGRL